MRHLPQSRFDSRLWLLFSLSLFHHPPGEYFSLHLSLCCDAIVKGSTRHRVRLNRVSSVVRFVSSVPLSIMHPEPRKCLLPDAPLEIPPWFSHLKARQTSNLHLKSLVPLLTHGLSASRSHSGSIKGRGYNAGELDGLSRERPTSQAHLEQPPVAVFTPSCGGPRCGSILFGTSHPSRDSKRWRSRSTRPRVVTRTHVEGLGLLHMMDQGRVHVRMTRGHLIRSCSMVRKGGHHSLRLSRVLT